MSRSRIEWTQKTWQVITGCDKVSTGCKNCYAERFSERWRGMGSHHMFNLGFDVVLQECLLDKPLRMRDGWRIFVCPMSDYLHERVPFEFDARIFDVICDARCEHHMFQLLTKRPHRWAEFIAWTAEHWPGDSPFNVAMETGGLRNCWMGTSVENQGAANRLDHILNMPGAVQWISIEPLLNPVDISKWLATGKIGWVVVGGESGPGARPLRLEWVRSVIEQCRAAGVPVFVKQLGEDWSRENGRWKIDRKGSNPDDWPADLRIREWPAGHEVAA